jgi:hypothetical protein
MTTSLRPQQVEVLRRSGRVGDADVVLGAGGQEAFESGAGVLRALPLEAVRQQEHQPALLAPLVLGGHDELVDDDLGAVHEVAELRLPQDQRVLVLHGVAVLEAEGGVLRQQRVVQPDVGLVLGGDVA